MINKNRNRSLERLFESWATTENPMNSTEEILEWIEKKKEETTVRIKKIDYDYDGEWFYDSETGEIRNRNNTFFQIKGLRRREDGVITHEQPIILQSEIGYLGIIGKEIDGVLYFLMQAKIEPGNVNVIQISPTLQATKSNFMQVHGGKVPPYLEYFSNKNNHEIIVDQIQSEQSSRFLGKRNRNIIIIVDDDIEVLQSHKWMTLGQIKELMNYDNLVNMDTRTVLSCIPVALRDFSYKELMHIRSLFKSEPFFASVFFGNSGSSINEIFQHVNETKMMDRTEIQLADLHSLDGWNLKNGEFYSESGEFKIVYCDIEIEGREVRRWQQPLLEAAGSSVFGLIYCIDEGEVQFLIQTKKEVGCFDKVEIGPSVQLSPHENPQKNAVDKFFTERLGRSEGVVFSKVFSEEGGRFYHEQNQNVIMKVDKDELDELLPEGYFWVSYQTLNILVQFNNCLNIQLRNLISILTI